MLPPPRGLLVELDQREGDRAAGDLGHPSQQPELVGRAEVGVGLNHPGAGLAHGAGDGQELGFARRQGDRFLRIDIPARGQEVLQSPPRQMGTAGMRAVLRHLLDQPSFQQLDSFGFSQNARLRQLMVLSDGKPSHRDRRAGKTFSGWQRRSRHGSSA